VISFEYAVGREKIREYASAIGETNPLYFDPTTARLAGFRDVVAPPMFAAVYAGPPFRELLWSPELGIDRRMTVHGGQEFSWHALAVAGDLLTTEARLLRDGSRGRNRVIEIATVTRNQDVETVANGTWTVFVRPAEDRISARPGDPR
jgi:acyl dehydratase